MRETESELHGGNVYLASERFNIAVTDILDFSSNINPMGIPAELKRLLMMNITNLIHYPDPESTGLRNHISYYLGVAPDRIIIGNGAAEIIFLLLATLKPSKLLLCAPTFSEYEKAAAAAGVPVDFFPLAEGAEYKLDIDQFVAQVRECDCVLLCNPNNPTSVLLNRGSDRLPVGANGELRHYRDY